MKTELTSKFEQRKARVAVIGLGYVGLPMAVNFAQTGYEVIGIDLDAHKVDAINRGESYIEDVASSALAPLVKIEKPKAARVSSALLAKADDIASSSTLTPALSATTDFAVLLDCDAVSICVPTPLSKTDKPDISNIVAATEQITRYLHPGMMVVLESTTYPGTTTEVVLPRLCGNGEKLEVGEDFFLAFSPERVDPGRTDWTTHNTPKVMGGVTSACMEVATGLL